MQSLILKTLSIPMQTGSNTKIKLTYAGASTRGPGHKLDNIPNQDAWIFRKFSWGFVGVVADGLGSHVHSQIGSKAVCRAVVKALNIWRQHPDSTVEQLLFFVHKIWLSEIGRYNPNQCGTTCLFAAGITSQDRLLVGQLGDGIIYVQHEGTSRVINERQEEYSNLTNSIHRSETTNWICERFNMNGKMIRLLLATDGISEDLIQSRISDFVDYVDSGAMQKKTQIEKNQYIKRMQLEWPTPMHSDDKTLLMIKVGDQNAI